MHSTPRQTPSLAANHRLTGPNQVWCTEMMRPDLQGRPLILLIVDAHTRHPLLAVPATSVADIATTLERLCRQAGRPRELRIDHALEFNPALRTWAHEHGVGLIHVPPTPQWKAMSEPVLWSLAEHLRGKHFTTAVELGHDLERWRMSHIEATRPLSDASQ